MLVIVRCVALFVVNFHPRPRSLWYSHKRVCYIRTAFQWRHNEHHGVSNIQHLDCLLIHLLKRTSDKYRCSSSLAFVRVIHRWQVYSPDEGPVTRKIFPSDDAIMPCSAIVYVTNATHECLNSFMLHLLLKQYKNCGSVMGQQHFACNDNKVSQCVTIILLRCPGGG